MLTERLGLWDFLSEEVDTYRNIIIEFLSSYEFDRASRNAPYSHQLYTTDLMASLGLPTENVEFMCTTLRFYSDMSEHQFRVLTCHDGQLGPQRIKNVLHPAICYLQRVISHTLFSRGETVSVFNFGDMTYVCSMLRRNNGEMWYMPHLGYHLAKHIPIVAHNRLTGGIVHIRGIITKIARFLQIRIENDIVPGYTLVDIAGLERARLIKFDDIEEAWINLGPSNNIRHRLPLQTELDRLNYDTWKIVDEPLELQPQPLPPPPPPPPPPPVEPAHAATAQPQGGPFNQQIWDFMQLMQAFITTMSDNMNNMRLHIDGRFNTIEQRMDEVEAKSAAAHHYTHMGVTRTHPDYEDDPPTPPYLRRAATRRELGLARQREVAANAQAEQAATTAQQDHEGGEEDDEDDDTQDNMEDDE